MIPSFLRTFSFTYVLLTCKVLFPFHASPLNARLVFIGLPGCLISIFKHKMSKMKFLFFLSNPAPFPFPSQFMADPSLQFAHVKKWSHPFLAFILHVQSISWHLASVFKACLESATFHHHPSSNHQYFSLELLPSLLVCLLPLKKFAPKTQTMWRKEYGEQAARKTLFIGFWAQFPTNYIYIYIYILSIG